MKILVLGGTEFLGKHLVNIAKNDGHEIVLFNRGKSNPDLFQDLETIKGDRYKDLEKLKGYSFDAVIDTSGYFPKNIEYSTTILKDIAKTYLFVSTCSIFDMYDQPQDNITENGKLVDLEIDIEEDVPQTYGARKYLCEEIIKKNYGDDHFIVRPGLIVGPDDPTYRFPYWADRMSEGGNIIAPGKKDAPIQIIDVRDLALWMLEGLKNNIRGVFNTVSPYNGLTLEKLLETIKKVINPNVNLTWIDEKTLKENEISCWRMLPLWIYEEIYAFQKLDSSKAIAAGLKFRPIEETIQDTHDWSKEIYKDKFLGQVLSRDKESELLSDYISKK